MDKIIAEIEKRGYLTGSRCWNCSTDNSDYDYFMTDGDYNWILDIIKAYKIEVIPSNYKSGCYVVLNNKRYNLIKLRLNEIPTWRLATEALKSISHNPTLRLSLMERDIRVDLFHFLKLFYSQNRNADKIKRYL